MPLRHTSYCTSLYPYPYSPKKVKSLDGNNTYRTRLKKDWGFWNFGVEDGARTHDTQNHNLVL